VQQIKCISVYNAENTQGLKSYNLQDNSSYLENIPRKSKEVGREEEAGILWIFGIPNMFPRVDSETCSPSSQCVPQNVPNSIIFYHIFFAQH